MRTGGTAPESSPEIRTYRIPTTATGEDAPTFVLLHGIGLSHRFYGRLGRALSRTGPVVSFDLPGFGPTRHPGRRLSVEDHAALVAAQLTRLSTGPVVVIGHSMGAQFATELARTYPHLVSHVILIGPVVDAAHRTLRAQAWALLRDAPLEPPRTQTAALFDYVRCGIPWFLTEAFAMRDYPTHERIVDVSQPLLVLRGEHDPIAKAAWCHHLAQLTSAGTVETPPRTRHNAPHARPEAVAEAVRRFVQEHV
ncbi:alpha/beta fold hydrolase [Frondihabitans cladoniiphilus]|uniref:Alpha/beta fold hydrolase n=1 Tax=Frondihabitans cladoniiphilus TaxID=715785 RepID=A0ABP8W3M1_9MICO